MISLNQQNAHTVMTGGLSATGASGFVLWVENNYSLISLGFVAFAALVGVGGAVISFFFQKARHDREKREAERKEQLHKQRMDSLQTVKGTDDAGKAEKSLEE